ncbi:MAG: 3-hydroxyacyl-ACP dehydratase FabZ [Deltaproteobacteria bacterium]|nr:3-hydroxyacyl-ACP dehydratase FabZ [Deltaproteobacteria bacterium]
MELKLPLNINDIEKIIPHRYPFLLVDRVIEFSDSEKIVGYKNITANEPFFVGHFPGRPLMPGVLMLEALAQLGAIFAKLSTGGAGPEDLVVLSGFEDIRFRRQVIPGDVLRMEMSNETKRSRYWKMKGVATVDGEKAVEGIWMAAIV